MTGQDIQDALDKIVEGLQTDGKRRTVQIMLRSEDNSTVILPLSSDADGNVDINELTAIQNFLNGVKTFADAYDTAYAPVKVASEAFTNVRKNHQALIDASSVARKNLSDALEADQAYQTAKDVYDQARQDANYIAARNNYKQYNVSENFGNLSDARGKYI